MSNREIFQCRFGGTLSAVCCVICFAIGIAVNASGLLMSGLVMAVISASYWIKLAMNPVPRSKPNKETAAGAAAQLQGQTKNEQLEQLTVQHMRRSSYLGNPVPLQIRRWSNRDGWGQEIYRRDLDAPLYLYLFKQNLAYSSQSRGAEDQAVIYQQDGVWYLQQVGFHTVFRMNDAEAQRKCVGMTVNDRQIKDMINPCVLLPGDCLHVTILGGGMPGVPGSADSYFRIEERM